MVQILSDRRFSVRLGDSVSSSAPLTCEVPQGSFLEVIPFSIYMHPVGFIFLKYGISFDCYADDIQIYPRLKQEETLSNHC